MFSVLALGAASALAYAGAAVAQRAVAAAATGHGRRAALRGAAWWVSLALNLLGAALHTAALRFGSLVAVQMLGVLTLVAAPLLSALVRRRRTTAAQCSGIACAVAGVAGLLFLTRSAQAGRTLTPVQTAGVLGLTAAVLGISVVVAATARRGITTSLWYAVAAGVAFGSASALTQTAVLELTRGGAPRLPLSAVALAAGVACLAVAGLTLSQLAYRGGLEAPLATLTLVNPGFAVVVGVLVLGDRYPGGLPAALAGCAAAVVAARGVLVLARTHTEAAAQGRLVLREPVEVHVHGGREPLDELLEVERGERLHPQDVPQHHQAGELRGHQ